MTTLLPRPRHRRHILSIAIALGLALAGPALAQDEFSLDQPTEQNDHGERRAELTEIRSSVEFGFGFVDDGSFRFGRYNGLQQQGGYGVLNIDWFARAAYDSPDPVYTRVTASNLGLDNRRVHAEHGRQGDYRLRADYIQRPMARSDSAQTIFDGVGSSALTLPGDWVGAQNTAGMSTLLSSLHPVDIDHQRRRIGLGFDKLLARGWNISTDVRRESKTGLKTIGAVIGNSGGNPRAVLLPEPVDYETRDVDVALRYSDPHKQFELRYLVSLFEDRSASLSWQNPYTAINGWAAAAGFPTGAGQLALPPDNQFHQGSAALGYTWANGLHLTADLALGRMTQNEDFLPYTINPQLADSIVQPLPRSSLDGRIDSTVGNLRLSGRPTTRFSWNAAVRYDDRDNRTPRDEYVYIGGDSQTQDAGDSSSRRRFNEPYSYRDTRYSLDGAYRFGRRTQLTGKLEQRITERTYAERERAEQTTASLNLRHALSDWFAGALRLERADRSGSTYHGEEPFLSGYSPAYTDTSATGWENPPLLRKYFEADRIRDRIGGTLTLMPNEHWQIGIDGQRIKDDYRHSELGLTVSDSEVYTVDVSFMPVERWTGTAFYTSERMDLDQNGVSISGATAAADALNPGRFWTALHRQDADTVGLGLQWKAIDQRLDLALDYLSARTRSDVAVIVGDALTAAPLPANRTRLASTSLSGTWKFRSDLSLRVRLWNEHYRSSDIALDGVEANQLANVILLGEDSPDYDVNVIAASLIYRF